MDPFLPLAPQPTSPQHDEATTQLLQQQQRQYQELSPSGKAGFDPGLHAAVQSADAPRQLADPPAATSSPSLSSSDPAQEHTDPDLESDPSASRQSLPGGFRGEDRAASPDGSGRQESARLGGSSSPGSMESAASGWLAGGGDAVDTNLASSQSSSLRSDEEDAEQENPHEGLAAVLLRDEGLCLYALGRHVEASEVLQGYLRAAPSAPDALQVYALTRRIQALQEGESDGGAQGEAA